MENEKHPHSARPRSAHGHRDSAQPIGGGGLAQPVQRARRAHTRGHHARRRTGCSGEGGASIGEAATARLTWWRWQGLTSGAAQWHSGGRRRRWRRLAAAATPVGEGGASEVPQHEREKSEVRHDPKEEEDGSAAELAGKAAMAAAAGSVLAALRCF
jgi:hypothetical protein